MQRKPDGKQKTKEAKARLGVFKENRGRSFFHQHSGDSIFAYYDVANL
jgi:hypothetical protein